MKSATIPATDGGRCVAYTEGDRTNQTVSRGNAEDAAIVHYERIGYTEPQRVQVVNSGGRGYTFRVWKVGKRTVAREVL